DCGYLIAGNKEKRYLYARETRRLSLLRPLDSVAAVAAADSVGRAAAIDGARGGGGGTRRGRGVFPRSSFRPPARFAVPAARGLLPENTAYRVMHRGHRTAT